ncbi:MAG: response regulator [Alphaproteobacteria bacterium]|nr:response regulator [Alphaproteobacteria bacterium]
MAEILLIDDMCGVRRAVTSMLGRAGHVVTVSENGTDGLAMLRQRRFDLVVTDMLMPGADGKDVLNYVRELPSRMPVIAISGGGVGMTADGALRLARVKADGLLEKPFTREELTKMVDRLLGNYATGA